MTKTLPQTLPQEIPSKQMICMGVKTDTNQRGEWHHSTRWALGPGLAVPWFPTMRFNLISPSQLAIMVTFSISGQKCSSLGRSAATDTPGSLPWSPFADQSQGEATDHSPLCASSSLRCSAPSLPGRTGRKSQLRPFLQQVSGKGLPHLFQ